jgi:hypothetical protein
MPLSRLVVCLLPWTLCLSVSSCTPIASPQQTTQAKWTSGFWFWNYAYNDPLIPVPPVDSLYVHAGSIRQDVLRYTPQGKAVDARWAVWGDLPNRLPQATEYWLVFRYELQGVPDPALVPQLNQTIAKVSGQARTRNLKVTGVQLDIDSPTGSLPQYAKFLAHVRAGLPAGYKLSITALLDWFRKDTSIAEVIAQTDEFVPQFYDTGRPDAHEPAIAAKVDADRWGPVFRAFKKSFRVGISTFGRARFAQSPRSIGYPSMYGNDISPLDLAADPNFRSQNSQNAAGELVLTYRAIRTHKLGYQTFQVNEGVEFILATPESVRTSVDSARRMGAAGAIFFRWPSDGEALSMQPNEVLSAARVRNQQPAVRVLLVDGGCAVTHCVDVYLQGAESFSPTPIRYRLHSSAPLDYFLPQPKMPVRMVNNSAIELTLPPYCGRGRLLLGRAVSAEKTEFKITTEQQTK